MECVCACVRACVRARVCVCFAVLFFSFSRVCVSALVSAFVVFISEPQVSYTFYVFTEGDILAKIRTLFCLVHIKKRSFLTDLFP